MSNRYTETTSQSWGSRLAGSIKGVMLGIVLFIASFPVLWTNEGRAVKTAKGLTEGAGVVKHIESDQINESNEGKLVHLSDVVISDEQLIDNTFGISTEGLGLERKVEMFQWVENTSTKKDKNIGGSETTETTYDYEKTWKTTLVNSSNFKVEGKYFNPNSMPFEAENQIVNSATIGEFEMSSGLLASVSGYQKVTLTPFNKTSNNPTNTNQNSNNYNSQNNNGNYNNNGYYENFYRDSIVTSSFIFIGDGTPQNPRVGDVKISFKELPESKVSIVAQQNDNSFEPYQTETGTTISLLEMGQVSAESMFESAQSRNTMWTWALRVLGFLMMSIGISRIFNPLVILADVLPFFGTLLGSGISLFSSIISLVLSFIIIAIAWIRFRPIIGISMLVVAIGIFVFFYMRSKKKRQAKIKNSDSGTL